MKKMIQTKGLKLNAEPQFEEMCPRKKQLTETTKRKKEDLEDAFR